MRLSTHDADTRRLCEALGIDGKYCGVLIEAGITTKTLASFHWQAFAHVLESLDIPKEIVGALWGAIDGMREGREGREAKRAAPPAPRPGTDTGKRRKAAASPKVDVAARDRPVCRLCMRTCSVHRRHPDTGDMCLGDARPVGGRG